MRQKSGVQSAREESIEVKWPARANAPELRPNQAHVWCLALKGAHSPSAPIRALLDEDELLRAAKFKFELHRNRYIQARSALRKLLGQYLDCPAPSIRFRYSESGKPFLEAPPPPPGFGFNISHSDDVALLAFGWTAEIGVDIEKIRPLSDREEIARRFFAPGEYAVLSMLPLSERDEAFYRCWTRKEAFLKARGTGIFHGLKNFEVSLVADEPARLLKISDAPEQVTEWNLHELAPAPDFLGALAVRAPAVTVLLYSVEV